MDLIQFIPEELLILVVAVYVLGAVLKSLYFIKDEYITILLLVFSIMATLTNEWSMNSIFLGIIATGIAVLGNQTIKQLTKK